MNVLGEKRELWNIYNKSPKAKAQLQTRNLPDLK
jgi:hypothetical protein